MGNRMLKEGIRTSKQIGGLGDFEFRLWAYLLTYVDDYGRGSADAELLKGFLFARRRGTTEKNIEDALYKLACAGLVVLYEVDGEPFLYFPTWAKHQRIQSKVSKYPSPEDGTEVSTVVHGESRKVTEDYGDIPLETKPNRNQIETNTNTNREDADACAQIMSAWNALPLAHIEAIKKGTPRYKATMARIKENGLDKVLEAISMVGQSDFLLGQKKDWKASYDWFITPGNFQKVIEGTYGKTAKNVNKGATGYLGDNELAAIDWLMKEA